MSEIWLPCVRAKPLAQGFGGTSTQPHRRIRALRRKSVIFIATFQDFMFILNQERMIQAWGDDFRRTFDECEDFLSDFPGGQAFNKGAVSMLEITDRMARYIYTDDDIAFLEQRIDLQIHVMHAEMDEIILKHFMLVLARSGSRVDQDSIGLAKTESSQSSPRLKLSDQQAEQGQDTKYLYDLVKQLLYRLETMAPAISQEEIERVRRTLQLRFQMHERLRFTTPGPFAMAIPNMDIQHFNRFSRHRLDELLSLLRKQGTSTTRQRVYIRESPEYSLPEPAMLLPEMKTEASILIQNTPHVFILQSIDIVTQASSRLLVSTSKDGSTGIVHHLPLGPEIYPFTPHIAISPSFHEREVSIFEGCLVEIVGSKICSIPDAIPLYNFPSLQNASLFQSSLRGKHLLHTFDTVKISSERGEVAFEQTVKLWSDFDRGQASLSFYQHLSNPLGHRDFPIDWFQASTWKKRKNNRIVHLKFGSAGKKISRLSSWTSSIISLPYRAFSRSSRSSSSTVSDMVISGAHPSPTSLADSPSVVNLGSGISSPASSNDASAGGHMRDVAMAMVHLEIEFTTVKDAKLFKEEFLNLQGNQEPYDSSPVLPEGQDLIFRSEIDLDFDGQDQPKAVEAKNEFPLIKEERYQHKSAGGLELYRTKSPDRYYSDNSPVTDSETAPEMKTKVFRVQGIPMKYARTNVEAFIRSTLNVHPSITIEIRSFATNHDQESHVATFLSNTVPRSLSNSGLRCDNQWSFPYRAQQTCSEGRGWEAISRYPNIQVDTHFQGLTMLYSPPFSVEHKIDICAIAGLGGHAYGSFKERGGSYMWLIDSLPFKFPYARVMTYGFDTRLEANTSNQDIGALAAYLLNTLEAMRKGGNHEDGVSRPLIFIAHSLGGLVVKELMMATKVSKDHQPLLDSIHSALFFGVPNRGMDIEALRPIVRDQPNEYLLHTLSPETETLRKQSIDFRKMFNMGRPEIMYFYESRESRTLTFDGSRYVMEGPLKMLVSKSSATDGWYYEEGAHNIFPLDTDHSHLVKFKQHDKLYPAVLNVMQKVVSKAVGVFLGTKSYVSQVSGQVKGYLD